MDSVFDPWWASSMVLLISSELESLKYLLTNYLITLQLVQAVTNEESLCQQSN